MMKVLVTGSTGFIGGALCRALVERGHRVRAFHRATSNLRQLEGLEVDHAIGDLTQADSIQAAMQGIEIVFHAGALLGANQPGRMYAVTVEGTRAVLKAALMVGIRRLVHTSSVAALGIPDQGPIQPRNAIGTPLITETHTWNFRPQTWPYGYAKYLAELEVQKAVAQGLDAVIVNPSIVIGPGDIYRQSSSIIVQQARQRVPFLADGGANIVHLSDVIDGHLAALDRGRCGERYILGGENMTHVSLIENIAAVTQTPVPRLVFPGSLVRSAALLLLPFQRFLSLPVSISDLRLAGYFFYYETRKAQIELRLSPPRPTSDAIQTAVAWFKQVGALGSN